MNKTRLEAFSDGVIAIIITIMVLELNAPEGETLSVLVPLIPIFLSYVLSFIYIGIYWNNHHHLLHAVQNVRGPVLWANLHFLFWLSLIPFTTSWAGENHFAHWPVFLYGVNLLLCAFSYSILVHFLIKHQSPHSKLEHAIGKDLKGKISMVLYIGGIVCSFLNSWVAYGFYIVVAGIWFVPDSRIEKEIDSR